MGDPDVISELTFCRRYTSFWQKLLPMGPAVVRTVNRRLKKPFTEEKMGWRGWPVRWDLVSEWGLRRFEARVRDGAVSEQELDEERVAGLGEQALDFIQRQRGPAAAPLRPPTDNERQAAGELATRLVLFVGTIEAGQPLTARPRFSGCGVVDKAAGDLLVGATLYEMKASDEGFRLVDLRQLAVYCALDLAAGRQPVPRVGLVNPRLGTYFRSDMEWLIEMMGGRIASDLLTDLVDFLCSERISA
jgi:hypothetical protein